MLGFHVRDLLAELFAYQLAILDKTVAKAHVPRIALLKHIPLLFHCSPFLRASRALTPSIAIRLRSARVSDFAR